MMEVHGQWVDAFLKDGSNKRDARWTESIAVGDKEFVLETKARLGAKALGRKISEGNGHYELSLTVLFLPLKSADYALKTEGRPSFRLSRVHGTRCQNRIPATRFAGGR
jgi:hypothetical protein